MLRWVHLDKESFFASGHSVTWVTIKDEVPEPWHHLFPP